MAARGSVAVEACDSCLLHFSTGGKRKWVRIQTTRPAHSSQLYPVRFYLKYSTTSQISTTSWRPSVQADESVRDISQASHKRRMALQCSVGWISRKDVSWKSTEEVYSWIQTWSVKGWHEQNQRKRRRTPSETQELKVNINDWLIMRPEKKWNSREKQVSDNDSHGDNRDTICAFIGGFVTGVDCQAWMNREEKQFVSLMRGMQGAACSARLPRT